MFAMAQHTSTSTPSPTSLNHSALFADGLVASQTVDVLVVGAGVCGLHAAFQLGLQELSVAVVDCLPFAGGQCVQLYAEKPIYDIPGVSHCTGQSLVDGLLDQLQPLDVRWALGTLVQCVERVEGEETYAFSVQTDKGVVRCKALLFATGVGAFVPRMPKIQGLDALPQGVVHTDVSTVLSKLSMKASKQAQPSVVVLGGEAGAVQAVDVLVEQGVVPQLVFRRSQPKVDDALRQRFDALCQQGKASYVQGKPVAVNASNNVEGSWKLKVQHADEPVQVLPFDALLIAGGRTPQARNVLVWTDLLDGKHIAVEPTTCATAETGVYAIGDVAQYPHKNKLIVTAFHEAAQAAYAICRHLYADAPRPLEYTTSSSRLQRVLKVQQS